MPFRIVVFIALAAATLGAAEPDMAPLPVGTLVENMRCQADPTQSYTLYLPSGYTTEKRRPALLIFDPGGRSRPAAELFQGAAERWGWILLSSNDTRSGGPPEANLKAVNALWPEVHLRYASDPRRLYAAGFSAGGHLAFLLGKQSGELAGVIANGSRLLTDQLQATRFALFAAAGDRDFNYAEMRAVDELVAEQGNPHRFEVFPGRHSWMPAELAAQAVAWMELVAMRRELRPRDLAAVEELLARDLTAARELEAAGDPLAALRRFEMVARTYDGLAEVAAARVEAARLASSLEVAREVKDERHWLAFEQRMQRRFAEVYARLEGTGKPMSAPALRDALDVASLQRRAEAPGREGVTARRLLSTLYVQASSSAFRPLYEGERWRAAVALLTVASELYDGSGAPWTVWYNLACVHARARHRDEAVRALERAVAEGFDDVQALSRDPDLASLQGTAELENLVRTLEGNRPQGQ